MKKITVLLITIFSISITLAAQTFGDYNKINECEKKKDFQCAENKILEIISLLDKNHRDLSWLFFKLGNVQFELGKYKEALTSYNKSYELKPEKSLLTSRAYLKTRIKDFKGALADLDEALKSTCTPDLLYRRSSVELMMRDTAGAIKDLLKILEIEPKHVDALIKLTQIRIDRGDIELALKTCNNIQSIMADSTYSKAKDKSVLCWQYMTIGFIQNKLKKYDEALASYNIANRIKPDDIDVLYYRALLKKRIKNHGGSLADCNEGLKIKADNIELLLLRSDAKKALKDTAGAEEDLLRILEKDPKNYYACVNMARIKGSRGEFDAALRIYDSLIVIKPSESMLYNNRAYTYNMAKKYNQAMQDVDKAIELKPDNGTAYVTKGEILIAMGERNKALEYLQKAVALGRDDEYVLNIIDECKKN